MSSRHTPSPSKPFPSPSRESTAPPPYDEGLFADAQFAAQLSVDPPAQAHNQVVDTPPSESLPPDTVHRYNLLSRGSDFVSVEVFSRALSAEDCPLLHPGEELKGFILLSRGALKDMERIDIVMKVFNDGHNIPSDETKHVLLPQHFDTPSSTSRWPFSFPPPATTKLFSSSSSIADTTLGHRLPCDRNSNFKDELTVSMHRHGIFAKKLTVKQQIYYVPPPDTSTSMPTCASPTLSDHSRDPPVKPSWQHQELPAVLVKGVMFGRHIEVECRLEIPTSYPVSDNIPLRLIMTSNTPEAVDLVSVSQFADVRLFKVLAFGDNANTTRPLTLKDRGSYHHKDLIAEVRWELDCRTEERTMNQAGSPLRTRVVLNGEFRRKEGVEIRPSFTQGDLALKYVVCLFPFRAAHFRPAGNPKKALLVAGLPLTGPN